MACFLTTDSFQLFFFFSLSLFYIYIYLLYPTVMDSGQSFLLLFELVRLLSSLLYYHYLKPPLLSRVLPPGATPSFSIRVHKLSFTVASVNVLSPHFSAHPPPCLTASNMQSLWQSWPGPHKARCSPSDQTFFLFHPSKQRTACICRSSFHLLW